MGTSVVIDDDLLAEARRLAGLKETNDVMREALRALIERESARRLANLGGTEPELRDLPRRRSDPA
jgi:Arc/MetJ family transcription regulator